MTGLAPATTLEVMGAQRACRTYTVDQVSDVDLTTMIEAATHAPSAENRQPWIFVVVDDAAVRAAIDDLGRQIWAAGGRSHAETSLSPTFFAEVDRFFEVGHGGAPLLVIIAGDGRDGSPPALLASSVFPAVQNLLLAASALGYGSTMTTLAAQVPDELARLLELPTDVRPLAAIPIGRPSRPLGIPRRRPVVEIAHRNRFGAPFQPGGASC